MLSRLSVLFVYLVAGLAASAVATPMGGQSADHGDGTKQPSRHSYAQKQPHYGGNSHKGCNVDKQYCCDTVNKVIAHDYLSFWLVFKNISQASETETADLLSVFGFAGLFDANALIGKNCAPFLAAGGGKCEAEPVCCDQTTTVRSTFITTCVSCHLFIYLTGGHPRPRMLEF